MKKYFKIFVLQPDFHGVYTPTYTLKETNFFSENHYGLKTECEQVVQHLGKVGVQYAIVETWEKETE